MSGFSKTKAVGFFVTGAAAGAVAALLMAPKTGAQMRKDFRRLSKRTLNQLDDLKSDLRDQISESYAQVKRMIRTA
jgi:gas vesicle protein